MLGSLVAWDLWCCWPLLESAEKDRSIEGFDLGRRRTRLDDETTVRKLVGSKKLLESGFRLR
jgi:hypothetical protein